MNMVGATAERAHLLMGVAQGTTLYALMLMRSQWHWTDTNAGWLGAAVAWTVFGPLIVHLSWGTLQPRRFWVLLAGSSALLLALGFYQGATHFPVTGAGGPPVLPTAAVIGMALLSFMMPPLVAAWRSGHSGAALRFWHYPTLFDLAWRNAVVVLQGAVLAGLLLAVLLLGTGLLAMAKVNAPYEVLTKGNGWIFVLPAAAAWGTGIGIHRPNFTAALRRHWFVFSRWMLPLVSALGIALALAGVFNLSAVSSGDLSHGMLLWFLMLWVMLFSCAFEAGEATPDYRPRLLGVLRFAAQGLLVLLGLSVYSFVFREVPGALSTQSLWVVLLLCIGAVYAVGYGLSALRRDDPWMRGIGPSNVLASLLAVVGIVLLLSPVLDIRKLAVQSVVESLPKEPTFSQLQQLHTLRSMGLPGHSALMALSEEKDTDGRPTPTATSASDFLQKGLYGRTAIAAAEPAPAEVPQLITEALFQMHPSGTAWPTGLFDAVAAVMEQTASNMVRGSCFSQENTAQLCQVLQIDLNQDGRKEAVVWHRSFGRAWVFSHTGESWTLGARLAFQRKTLLEVQRELQAGRYETLPPKWRNLRLGTNTIQVEDALP